MQSDLTGTWSRSGDTTSYCTIDMNGKLTCQDTQQRSAFTMTAADGMSCVVAEDGRTITCQPTPPPGRPPYRDIGIVLGVIALLLIAVHIVKHINAQRIRRGLNRVSGSHADTKQRNILASRSRTALNEVETEFCHILAESDDPTRGIQTVAEVMGIPKSQAAKWVKRKKIQDAIVSARFEVLRARNAGSAEPDTDPIGTPVLAGKESIPASNRIEWAGFDDEDTSAK